MNQNKQPMITHFYFVLQSQPIYLDIFMHHFTLFTLPLQS